MIAIAELKLTLVLDQAERGILLVIFDSLSDDHNLKDKAKKMSQQIKDTKADE